MHGAAEDNWFEVEDTFRVWSFNVYYRRTFRDEHHPLKRFVKALLASARPMGDRQAVVKWHRSRRRERAGDE